MTTTYKKDVILISFYGFYWDCLKCVLLKNLICFLVILFKIALALTIIIVYGSYNEARIEANVKKFFLAY